MAQYQNHTAKWPAKPVVSTLNWLPKQTAANLVQVNTGANGVIDLWNTGSGKTAIVVDAFGYHEAS